LNRCGIDTQNAEEEMKKQVQNIQAQGGIIPPELMIPIPDPEKNPLLRILKHFSHFLIYCKHFQYLNQPLSMLS